LQWNTIAGTAGQTYVVGSLFTAATIGASSGNGAVAVARTLANRFADVVNVKDFGAVGDGVADDTDAIQRAINAAGQGSGAVTLPKGIYSVNPNINVDSPVNIQLQAGCIVRQRSLGTTSGLTFMRFALFTFNSGAVGSAITGPGILEGNRQNLASAFLALPKTHNSYSYTIEFFYCGIVSYCSNLTICNLTIKGFLGSAILHLFGDNGNLYDIDIQDCTNALLYQSSKNAMISHINVISVSNIVNNVAIPVWQHPIQFRILFNCSINNITVAEFSAKVKDANGNDIGDPYPITFSFSTTNNSNISNLKANKYTYDPTDLSMTADSQSFEITSVTSCTFDNLIGLESLRGMMIASGLNNVFSNCVFDSKGNQQLNNVLSPGILICLGGINTPIGSVDTDYRATATTKDNFFNNIVISGYLIGVQVSSSDITLNSVKCFNNVEYGFVIREWIKNSPNFPEGDIPNIERVKLIGCEGSYNGLGGLAYSGGSYISVIGGEFSNNGQDSTSQSPLRNGIISAGSSPVSFVSHVGLRASDTQNFTKLKSISFIPSLTNNKNQISVLLNNPDLLHAGQRILVVNGTGSGDINAKIASLDKDSAILQTTSPETFSETGNLTTLTGTVSASLGSLNLTGSGTFFKAQIKGTCFIKINSNYYRVARVFSDTSLQVDVVGGLPLLSGATANLVLCDIHGIPSQLHGLYFVNNTTNMSFSDCQLTGNVVAPTYSATPSTTYSYSRSSSFNIANLPTSSAGLSSGDLWNNLNVINIIT
jgi:hypothetical protein